MGRLLYRPTVPATAISVLGPIELAGRAVHGRVPRVVLARLIVGPGAVSVDELAEAAWGDAPPASVRSTLKSHVSRLRTALRAAVGYDPIASHPGGYRLTVADVDLDVRVFEAAVLRARGQSSNDKAATLREALLLWRGPAFDELRYEDFAAGESARLEELRLLAIEDRIEADLALGRHREALADLLALVDEHPLRERLVVACMRALHADGRQRDALRVFDRFRTELGEASGLDPGPGTTELRDRILAGADLDDRRPELRYARMATGQHVGYVRRGAGPPWLLSLGGDAHVSAAHLTDDPVVDRAERQLSAITGLLRMDRPGIGLSDPTTTGRAPTMREWGEAAIAVADHAGVDQFIAFGSGWSAPPSLTLAVERPDRVCAVVILNGFARFVRADDHPIGIPESLVERFRDAVLDTGADAMPADLDDVLLHAPSLADDPQFRAWWRRAGQQGASPAVSRAHFDLLFEVDVRHLLHLVRQPTLIIQRRDNRYVRADHGRDLARRIATSTYVELDGADQLLAAGDPQPVIAAIDDFVRRIAEPASANRASPRRPR